MLELQVAKVVLNEFTRMNGGQMNGCSDESHVSTQVQESHREGKGKKGKYHTLSPLVISEVPLSPAAIHFSSVVNFGNFRLLVELTLTTHKTSTRQTWYHIE